MNRLHLIQVIIGVLFLCGSVAWAQEKVIVSDETSAPDTVIREQTAPETVELQPGTLIGTNLRMTGESVPRTRRKVDIVENLAADPAAIGIPPSSLDVGANSVLVIPTGDISVEAMKIIQEDMTIMGRILYKRVRSGADYGVVSDYLSTLNTLRGHWWGGSTVEGIYLQDYGVLYFLRVKIPLLPPAEKTEIKKTEEVIDPLWSQTKQELQTKQNTGYYTWRPNTVRVRSSQKPRYDAEKVEELKRSLLKALRHASNIRSLKADEWITVVVVGEGIQSIRQELLVQKNPDEYRGELIYMDPFLGQSGSAGQTVLTVRVKKADVDAAAKKDITQEEFEKRVQIFSYAGGGAELPAVTPSAPILSPPPKL